MRDIAQTIPSTEVFLPLEPPSTMSSFI